MSKNIEIVKFPENPYVLYFPNFFGDGHINMFKLVDEDTKWSSSAIRLNSGEEQPLNRKMAYMANPAIEYLYAGQRIPGQPWGRVCLDIRDTIEFNLDSILGVPLGHFNSVLLNRYNNGYDTINWHSDKEEQLGENPLILMVNLGATRTFKMKEIGGTGKLDIPLHNGDVFAMLPGCQANWLHAIKGEPTVKDPRISLTFRHVIAQ